jgi:hypothetical protein
MNRPLKSPPQCPTVGWQWLRAQDLHDTPGCKPGKNKRCEFCGQEKVQFVHYLSHPDCKRILAVGRKCAKILSGDPRVEATERYLCDRAQRKADFIHHKGWRPSAQGNFWIEYQGRHIVVVSYRHGPFKLRIDDVTGKLFFKNAVAAMGKAFDVLEEKHPEPEY